jgi:Lon protease-like protein
VPVFPLPDVVLFPGTVAPLHVFELRYRTMVRDALSLERMIALALVRRGRERDPLGAPEIHEIGCLASFDEVEWLPNDCYDLRVRGVQRVRFVRSVREYPYRAARIEPLPEAPYSEDDPLVLSEKRAAVARLVALGVTPEAVNEPAFIALPYAAVVNSLCVALDVSCEEKLALLALDSVIERGHRACALAATRVGKRPHAGPEGGRQN